MSFTPFYASNSARNTSSSSSQSFSSTPAMSPLFSRRASYSSSDDSDDELETPNASPQLVGLDSKSPLGTHLGGGHGKGKGKALDLEDLERINGEIVPFSLLEIAEDEGATNLGVLPQPPTFGTRAAPIPAQAATSTRPPSSSTSTATLVYPPGLPIPPAALAAQQKPSAPTPTLAAPPRPPAPATPAATARPRPQQPSPPSRQQEEASRGRSRWPRILWSSELDQESISVLRSYHSRVVGGDLPVLKQGMSPREVQRWSRKMEDAGL